MLEYLGYEVKLSRNGQKAIKSTVPQYRKEKPFGAIIMSLTIPGSRRDKI